VNERISREEILQRLYDLAFGDGGSDAAKLALGAADSKTLDGLDLRLLTGVHTTGSGGVEVKLIDRCRLIELLLHATEPKTDPADAAAGLIAALERSASRLGEGTGGDGLDP